jgi:hypothetical protein
MLEILTGTTAPTIDTIGEQGQLYIHQYQIGRRKFYGDLYICDIVHKYVNGPRDKDTIHYYWEKITPSKELSERLDLVETNLTEEIKNSVNYSDLNADEFTLGEDNKVSINLIQEEKVDCLVEDLNEIFDNGIFAQDLLKSEFEITRSPSTNRIVSVRIKNIDKEKVNGISEIENNIADLTKKVNLDIQIVPIDNILANDREYRLFHMGKIGRMDFKLPETIPNVFKGKIFIRSSDMGIQLNIDNVTFVGEDCVDGKLISNTSKYYEIAYENVGVHDEQYAPNKAIVIARVSSLPLEG